MAKLVFVFLSSILLGASHLAYGAVDTIRADLIGSWQDFSSSATIIILNGDGTGQYPQGTDITWSYNKNQGVLTLFAPDSSTTHTAAIISESYARMTVQWTSNENTYQVLKLDTSSNLANFSETDLVGTFQYTNADNTKYKYVFYADGYGQEIQGSGATGTTFTWAYANPKLTLTGKDIQLKGEGLGMELNGLGTNYEYQVLLYANKFLTLLDASNKILVLEVK